VIADHHHSNPRRQGSGRHGKFLGSQQSHPLIWYHFTSFGAKRHGSDSYKPANVLDDILSRNDNRTGWSVLILALAVRWEPSCLGLMAQ
jgi:hypothetical protein